ncbi:MAG: hypothetical protein B7Y56_00090 [Gallionellales bacterium 35-53-114]|jgi:Tfp pilus assembly protein PilF|nr:MAG: hypothetical protein B7Y56_00090 [Gallionellales bacterium 35-53-114]OYZ62239.1 MAG: hypothetical protein B7Y04_14725 [Gallionellales bacterium 24-53-125]OZB10640.1 MAG: hypothetical protein B7X61_03820 [Gallionellales bacterium 39-52-133]HQS57275.1 tetratricopeptide repeat protein [Gallionellaceae bacterium]HQS74537.1 tetratricopeptide repeat protein [Gallionellaceae bacterium]
MSLLLDALKKTGAAQQGANGQAAPNSLTEMTLEDLPGKTAPAATPAFSATPAPTPRSTGENLFAAKKAPAAKKFHYTLGIVPTAMIIGLILGTAGAIYVWIEIQPPKAVQYNNPNPAVAAYTAPAPQPAPALVLPPENMPEAEAKTSRAAPATQNTARIASVRRAPAVQSADAQSGSGIQIQRQQENDTTYTALITAYRAYQNGDLGTAWQRYREVLLKDPRNRDALLGMAAIAQQQGQDDAAVQYYRQVLMLDPRDPVAQAGMSAFSTGDASAKESRLKNSLAQAPQSAALHFALGNLYTEQSRWGDAQQAYFSAFRLEPSNAQFAFNLATSLDHLGQAKPAAQYYALALQLNTSGYAGFDRPQTELRLKQLLAPQEK